MVHFFNGLVWGIFLAILVGPLLFALIQTTLEKGIKYGFSVGSGIWFSDLLFILATYFGVNSIYKLLQWENFELTVGIVGGIILILIGSSIVFSKPPTLQDEKVSTSKIKGLGSSFGLGFIINTFNPFTVLFWLGVMTTTVEDKGLDRIDTIWFACGIFAMIVLADSVKIVFAQKIKKWLTLKHIIIARKISGIAMISFGLILIGRVAFF
jgi:threonine/homoserine/homoserine lactone efflux protein